MSTDVERAAHAYCPRCHPDPRPGESLTALCGARYPYYGRRERPVNQCPACVELVSGSVYACGHPGG